MPRIPIRFPLGGLSETLGNLDQPPATTRLARNVRGKDPITDRIRGAQRSGMERFCPTVTGTAHVSLIDMAVIDAKKQVYADLGDGATIEFAVATPGQIDARAIAQDRQANLYFLDGNVGAVKHNSVGVFLWKIAFPSTDKGHEVGALTVDPVIGTVVAGVSSGGRSDEAKMWGYRQLDDNETSMLWEITPGGYITQVRFRNGLLYVLLDFPDRNKSYVRVYGSIDTEEPEFQKEWEVPYPANDLDVSPKDESVFVASDSNNDRGTDPRSLGTTQASVDFTPFDLADYKKRIWAWFDATDRSTLALEPRSPESGDDGAEAVAWYDKLKSGRAWYRNINVSSDPLVPDAERGPLYRVEGAGGLPSLSFTGEIYDGNGPNATAGRSMVTERASSTDRSYRDEQLGAIPTYKGAQFAIFMTVKCGIDENIRGLLSLNKRADVVNSRQLSINRRDDNQIPGSIPMPGSVCLHEIGGATSSGESSPDAGGPSGPVGVTPGYLSGSGFAVITWICDGGVIDQTGTATRSTLRVNGRPIDRWRSASFFTNVASTLGIGNLGSSGHSRFAGEVCEMLVLADWYDRDGIQQRLLTVPGYPDAVPPTSGGALSDTECERIEGYMAHRRGFAHELPCGRAAFLRFTGQPAIGDTVTIGVKTYTFQDTLSAANDVKRGPGGNFRQTASNLYQAINRIGEPGTDYHRATEIHPDYFALAAVEEGATPDVIMGIQSRSPYAGGLAVSESSAALSWAPTTTAQTIDGAGSSAGHYPHPFALKKTNFAPGGPPNKDGNILGQTSPFFLLQSVYPQLTKWSANNGRLVWNATTGYSNSVEAAGAYVLFLPLGAVGYGVRVNSEGEVYSCGPPVLENLTGFEQVGPGDDDSDLRKIGDEGETFTVTPGGTGDPWIATLFDPGSTPSELGWSKPRMDVDTFDNIYLPLYYVQTGGPADAYADVSVVGYRRDSTGPGTGVEFLRYASLPFTNECYAVLADPLGPDLPDGDTIQHGEFLYLGAQIDATDPNLNALFKLRQISVTLNVGGPQRDVTLLSVNAGQIGSFDGTGFTAIAGGSLDSTADFFDSAVLYGQVFFTDGKSYLVYDKKTNLLSTFQSESAGLVQPRCKLMASWRGRLVLARPPESPQNWFMSKQGDPYNWDQAPFTFTEKTSIAGNDSRAGIAPDIINALIPYSDDYLLIGCDHSIHIMRGDPMAGGQIDLITDTVGMGFGRSWCKDPDGNIYFADTRGEIYRMTVSGSYKSLSRNRISKRLRDIDFTAYRLELAWNVDDDGLHVVVIPYGAPGVLLAHYFWEKPTDAWWEDRFGRLGTTDVQPTAMFVYDSDDPEDRAVLFGCEDGFIRKWSRTATNDDGTPIWSYVMIGPLAPKGEFMEWMFTDIDAVFATDQNAPNWYLHSSKVADFPGEPVSHGRFRPGRNPTVLARARGAVSFLALGLAESTGRWAFEQMDLRAEPMGRKRSGV